MKVPLSLPTPILWHRTQQRLERDFGFSQFLKWGSLHAPCVCQQPCISLCVSFFVTLESHCPLLPSIYHSSGKLGECTWWFCLWQLQWRKESTCSSILAASNTWTTKPPKGAWWPRTYRTKCFMKSHHSNPLVLVPGIIYNTLFFVRISCFPKANPVKCAIKSSGNLGIWL